MKKSELRSVLKSALLACVVTLSAIVGAELALRATASRLSETIQLYLPEPLKESLGLIQRIESEIPWFGAFTGTSRSNWTYTPDKVFEGTNSDGRKFRNKVNPSGFLSPSDPPPQARQVILIGDSILSTFYVEKPAAWVVQEKLDLPVLNLAVGGWGPHHYLDAYQNLAIQRNASIVAVAFFENDLRDLLLWEHWNKDDQQMELLRYSTYYDFTNNLRVETRVSPHSTYLDLNSVLFNMVRFVIDNGFFTSEPVQTAQHNGYSFSIYTAYAFLNHDLADFQSRGSHSVLFERYFKMLLALQAEAKKANHKLVLFWVPTKERVYIPLLPMDEQRKFVKTASGTIDAYEKVLASFAAEHQIDLVDLTPRLTEAARGPTPLYFSSDIHFNDYGNEALGRAIAEEIKLRIREPNQARRSIR